MFFSFLFYRTSTVKSYQGDLNKPTKRYSFDVPEKDLIK